MYLELKETLKRNRYRYRMYYTEENMPKIWEFMLKKTHKLKKYSTNYEALIYAATSITKDKDEAITLLNTTLLELGRLKTPEYLNNMMDKNDEHFLKFISTSMKFYYNYKDTAYTELQHISNKEKKYNSATKRMYINIDDIKNYSDEYQAEFYSKTSFSIDTPYMENEEINFKIKYVEDILTNEYIVNYLSLNGLDIAELVLKNGAFRSFKDYKNNSLAELLNKYDIKYTSFKAKVLKAKSILKKEYKYYSANPKKYMEILNGPDTPLLRKQLQRIAKNSISYSGRTNKD